ncbi:MAG TPA: RecX family transcriptional regulator, partial [Candidatus Andersenbacteria bacterium]|nr:RecX family transcriptional regulator [Candidatus Andersenbacteria bacterium]
LAAKLKQKGVGEAIIAAALEQAFPPGREAELARAAAAAWRRTHSPPARGGVRGGGSSAGRANHNQRLWRFLISRGFSTEVISTAVST